MPLFITLAIIKRRRRNQVSHARESVNVDYIRDTRDSLVFRIYRV